MCMDSEACSQLESLAIVDCNLLFKGPLFTAGSNSVATSEAKNDATAGSSEAAAVVVLANNVSCEVSEPPLSGVLLEPPAFLNPALAKSSLPKVHDSFLMHAGQHRPKRSNPNGATWVRGSKRLRTDIITIISA